MLVMSDIFRGFTDTIILSCLLKKDSYGYQINKHVTKATHSLFELKEATLYTTFRRLEEHQYITSYWGDEQTGARRRYYSITDKGKQLLEENINDWKQAKKTIEILLEEKKDEQPNI